MARKGYGRNSTLVNITTHADDGTSPVGSNEWNENPKKDGIFGLTKSAQAISGNNNIVVTDSYIEITTADSASGGSNDGIYTLSAGTASLSATNYASDSASSISEGDLIYVVKAASQGTTTLKHQQGGAGAGKITTLTGVGKELSATVPTILMARTIGSVLEWVEYGGGAVADLSITTAKLAADAVTAAKLADDAVVTANIVDLNVTTAKIAADAVTGAKLADDAVAAEHIAANAVVQASLADDAVGAAELASDAVVNASVASGAAIATSKLSGALTSVASHGLATSATTDTTSASNITGGTLPNAQLPDIVVADLAVAAVTLESEGIASTDNDTSFPTSAAVKDYVDTTVASDITLKGNYDASADSPSLDDGSPISGILKGDHYVVSAAGDFFAETMQVGDSIISKQDSPTTLAHWITVNNNIVAGTILTANLAADAVTGAKIADDSIDSEHIIDGSIDNAHIADNAIDSEHYADGSIDSAHIANDQIDSQHYAAGSIDNEHLADDAVGADELASNAVVQASIADNAVGIAELAGIARGKIIVGDASGNPALLAVGAEDTVLTVNASGDVGWEAAGGAIDQMVKFSNAGAVTTYAGLTGESQTIGTLATDNTNGIGLGNRDVYIRKIDANNEGVFTVIHKNGALVEVQIA